LELLHLFPPSLYGAIFVKGVPQGSYPFSRPSVSLLDLASVSSPRPTHPSGRRAQERSRLAAFGGPPGGLALDGSEHDGTLVYGRDDAGRGELGVWCANVRATSLYSADPKTRTHDAVMRIGSELRGGGPILSFGVEAMGETGVPPPRTVIGDPSQACGQGRNRQVFLDRLSLQCAGRRTTPSGTTPSRTRCHKAMSNLRARATIIFLRNRGAFSVRARNHLAKALSFW